ncbi:MAG: SRPBCC domain-containing protein [bacterium]|nr:SRPBCC domain-containing protein [bacterium]
MAGKANTDDAILEEVFRALGDPNRRRILDLLKRDPGATVGQICGNFDLTRFATMKHLRVLEGANLVTHIREGRTKRLYLNVIPLQLLSDRWLSEYSRLWAAGLTDLKYALEQEPMQSPPRQIYVVYIRAAVQKVWQALIDPAATRQYYFNMEIETPLTKSANRARPGAPFRYYTSDHETGKREVGVEGEIIEVIPERRLVHSFAPLKVDPDRSEPPSRVIYELDEQADGTVKLTVTHEGFSGETPIFRQAAEGWPIILSGLKTLLETGSALHDSA